MLPRFIRPSADPAGGRRPIDDAFVAWIRDLIGFGLVDDGWIGRLPTELQPRLCELSENPEFDRAG